MQRKLESRGYMIPSHYQQLVVAQCSVENQKDIDTYWNEVAREYICSAGQIDSATRSFPDVPCYRSRYLDALSSSRESSSLFKVTPLHPCYRELAVRRRTNPQLDSTIIKDLEAQKRPEIRERGIRSEMWTGQKKDVGPIFANLMKANGFYKCNRSFIRKNSTGLVFGAFTELGGRPYCIAVPISLFISAESDMTEIFELSPEMIVPGFWFYYRFASTDAAVLGFHAYADFIDIVSDSFEHLS